MQAQHQGMRQWLDVYSLEGTIRGLQPKRAVSVDIGGSIGHQRNALRQHLPSEVTNRIIVQDLDVVIAHTIPVEGAQTMPQPIKCMSEAQVTRPSMLCI